MKNRQYTTLSLIAILCLACETEKSPTIDDGALTLFDGMEEWNVFEGTAHSSEGSLSSLKTLERDFAFIHHYYVDSDQLIGPRLRKMLEQSLQYVESNVDEVQFVVYPSEIVSNVGTRSRSFSIKKLNDLNDMLQILHPIAVFLDGALSEDVDRPTVEYLLLNGALSALDPHSILLPPVEAAEMEVDNQGEFGGLGIEINLIEGMLTVKQPIEGTPAWDAGLKASDKIVRIENTSTINMDLDEAVSLLRGKVGEPVTIMVERTGWTAPKPFTIVRGRIKIDPVKGELLDGDIGYLKIQSFHKNVAEDMNQFLDAMEKESQDKLQGLIIDLRNNPGGYLNQAIKVSDRFLRNGVIVSTVEGAERTKEETHAKTTSKTLSDLPIAVLVNGNSASASEIVAGALRNQSRAIIIGERSFGKGSVQHLYGNPDESRLKLTVAQYLTPGDQSIQSVGIPPDILLQPSLIRPKGEDVEEMVSLYWREWIMREGDLDGHLSNESTLEGQTRFSVRYLYEEKEGADRTDPKKDWEVTFAKELLKLTEGVDRASTMIAAQTLVDQIQPLEAEKIQKQFEAIGIDWQSGVNHYSKVKDDLKLSVQILGDGVLNAGEEEELQIDIENVSERSYYQLSLLLESEHPSLDHREVYIGHVPSSSSQQKKLSLSIPHGYGTEKTTLEVKVRDSEQTMMTMEESVQTIGKPLPKFAWKIELFDGVDGKGTGNGNQIPEVGEQIVLAVEVQNTGEGAAVEPYIRLKNRSRKQMDLLEGTVELGTKELGCEEDCQLVLQAGDSQIGEMRLDVKALPEDDKWTVELLIGSNRSYDYNTAVMGGFSDYFQLKKQVEIPVGKTFEMQQFNQPRIVLDVQNQQTDFLELSGYVEDESGITDILVFNGEDKVYYKGETGLVGKVPFAVDVGLVDGSNPIYILAKDNEGLHTSQFVQVWK